MPVLTPPGRGTGRGLRTRMAFLHQLARARLSRRRVGVAVMWHRIGVVATEEARLDPAFPLAAFEAQVRGLARCFACVPASELRAAALARRRGQRIPVALTFDDDLDGHHALVAPVLERHGVRATFFLTGATLRGPSGFWWQRLDRALDRGLAVTDPLLPPVGEHAAAVAAWGGGPVDAAGEAVRTLPPAQRDALAEALLRVAGPDPQDAGLDAGQVADLVRRGFEIGFHTRRHDSLTALDDDALARAMVAGRAELEAITGRALDTIAYPHGDADARVTAAAADAGLRSGFVTRSGPVSPASDPLREPRFDATRLQWPALGVALLRSALRDEPSGSRARR